MQSCLNPCTCEVQASYNFWVYVWGCKRLFSVRYSFPNIFAKERGERTFFIFHCYQPVVLSFCLHSIFSSYSWFSHHSVTEYETSTFMKEIKVSKKSLMFFWYGNGGWCLNWFCFFYFFSLAAKNLRVKADKTALRLSHLPECGRKHESRINCFSQNRVSFLALYGLRTKLKGRWGFPPSTSASWISGRLTKLGIPPAPLWMK